MESLLIRPSLSTMNEYYNMDEGLAHNRPAAGWCGVRPLAVQEMIAPADSQCKACRILLIAQVSRWDFLLSAVEL